MLTKSAWSGCWPNTGATRPRLRLQRAAVILALHDELPEAALGLVVATRSGAADVPVYPVLVIKLGGLQMLDHHGLHTEPRHEHPDRYSPLGYEFECRRETRENLLRISVPTEEQFATARSYVQRDQIQLLVRDVRGLLAGSRPTTRRTSDFRLRPAPRPRPRAIGPVG